MAEAFYLTGREGMVQVAEVPQGQPLGVNAENRIDGGFLFVAVCADPGDIEVTNLIFAGAL